MFSNRNIELHQFIAELIHPELKQVVFTKSCYHSEHFWDQIVKIGSSHLILPSIYKALKTKKNNLKPPKRLMSFLEEITNENSRQNKEKYNQIDYITNLFNSESINYVFLKGAALLILNPFDAMNERMFGDIDILVSEDDIERAYTLLLKNGFKFIATDAETKLTRNFEGFQGRHINRLINPNYICAVELHRELLRNKYINLLKSDNVLKNKVSVKKKYFIPSKYNLWEHSILNWEINDYGYYFNNLSFRAIIDTISLEPKKVNYQILNRAKEFKHFYSLMSVFFKNYNNHNKFRIFFYKVKIRYYLLRKFSKITLGIINFLNHVVVRLLMFIKSSIYRNRILKNPEVVWKNIKKNFYKYIGLNHFES